MERPAGAEEKPWGWNLPLWSQTYAKPDGAVAVLCRGVRVFIRDGGFSSIHEHRQQQNWFYVNRGRLMLKTYVLDEGKPRQLGVPQWLGPDDHPVCFKAGVLHQFVAQEDVEALEIYMAVSGGDAVSSDIVRYSENGPRNLGTLMGYPVVTSNDLPDMQDKIILGEPGRWRIQPGSVETP